MNYQSRLKKLQDRLAAYECSALLIEHPVNLLYLTGFELSAGKLLIAEGSITLFVDGRYYEHCQQACPCPVVLFEEASFIKSLNSHDVIGFDSTHTTHQNVLRLEKWTSESSDVALKAIDNPVQTIRAIKDADEIALMNKAAQLNVAGVEFVCSILKEGISEVEVAVELELFWKRHGGRKLSFDPIIAFGPNSSMPHYRAGNTKLASGMPVLIDIGVTLNHYQSDMTRVVFFGPANPKLQEIYEIVEEAKEQALALCHPGTTVGELDAAARNYISEKGYGSNFTHSLGHGIGLETHETPILANRPPYADQVLAPGLVITIEPGIYVPGLGGIRLEDTIVITDNGYDILTK